ncbi:MAG: hypothetical protein KDJ43_11945 [Rhizobiaceae bacterium]|nr:hypothetical protein [Rhizobiaceae bacterium]
MVRYTGQSAEQIALAALLEQLEDFEDLRISEARMSDNPQFFSMEEAMFRLGIDLEKDPTDS